MQSYSNVITQSELCFYPATIVHRVPLQAISYYSKIQESWTKVLHHMNDWQSTLHLVQILDLHMHNSVINTVHYRRYSMWCLCQDQFSITKEIHGLVEKER